MWTLYGLINERGALCYIGQSTRPEKRLSDHKEQRTDCVVKSMVVLGFAESQEEANHKERALIALHGPVGGLLNKTKGGSGERGYRYPNFKSARAEVVKQEIIEEVKIPEKESAGILEIWLKALGITIVAFAFLYSNPSGISRAVAAIIGWLGLMVVIGGIYEAAKGFPHRQELAFLNKDITAPSEQKGASDEARA